MFVRNELIFTLPLQEGQIVVALGEVSCKGSGCLPGSEEVYKEALRRLKCTKRLGGSAHVERYDGFRTEGNGVEGGDSHSAEGLICRTVGIGGRDDGDRVRNSSHQEADLIA